MIAGLVGRLSVFIRRSAVRWSVFACFVYTLITIVVLYPVPFQLNSTLAGQEYQDNYQFAWQLWWVKEAVSDAGKSLTHVTLMNHPVGTRHPILLTSVAVDILAMPFFLLFSLPAVYNLQIMLSFIFSGMTMYWLCTELSGDRRAALVGGLIFAFFPNKTGHVLAGHLSLVVLGWFPLCVLFLQRAIQRPGWRTSLMLALALVPACLTHLAHLVYLLLPATLAMFLVSIAGMKASFLSRRRIGFLALAMGITILVILPFLLPSLFLFAQCDGYRLPGGTVKYSTDLLAFFTPSPYHPVLSSLGLVPSYAKQVFQNEGALREGLAYPGILAVGLALWGLAQRWRKAWGWGVVAMVVIVLSLGPLLKIGNEIVSYKVDTYQSYVVLPYALFMKVPIVQVGRTPGRFNEAVMFTIAILASYGITALPLWLTQRSRSFLVVLAFLLGGIVFEYIVVWPFPVGTAEIPPVMQNIAAERSDGGLLHIPATEGYKVNNRALFYQTYAERPIVRGFIHRLPPDVSPWSETLLGLAQPDHAGGDIVLRPDFPERVAWLRYFDVDYVLFHKLKPETLYRDFVQCMLGPPKYEDHTLAAFAVPEVVLAPKSPYLYTLSDYGWHQPEQDGGIWRRWLGEEGELYIYSAREGRGSLRFAVDSHLSVSVLEVYLDGQLLDAVIVDERTIYTTRPFTLEQGMNVFRFRAPGGCREIVDSPRCWESALLEPPAEDDVQPCDPAEVRTTCRTFVLDGVHFVPERELTAGEGLDINFGDQMRLRGWKLSEMALRPGEALTVTLAWEATTELSDRYVVFVHVLPPDGSLVAQSDKPIGDGLIPYAVWQPGTVFSYPVTLELPDGLPEGDYRLLLGVYLWPSLDRLPVMADVPGAEAGVVEIDTVRIVP